MDKEFWLDRRVFVTGHTGFKGGWLTLWLNSMGAVVKGYSLAPSTDPAFFIVAGVDKIGETEIADVRDSDTLLHSMQKFQPDVVFHLAAQPLVRHSFEQPVETFETNVMGTLNLLQAIRSVPSVRCVVNVTSDKCYENREWYWGYRENEQLGGHDPYSASKACSELVTSSYRRSFFSHARYNDHRCAIATARAGNVIGGGDWSTDRLVPDILRDLSNRHSVVVRSPLAVRPWQHVLEPLSGYLQLAQCLVEQGMKYAEAWNFGPAESNAQTVQSIVEVMIVQWGDDAEWRVDDQEHAHEARYLKLDCSKARDELDWNTIWGLPKALAAVVAWHKAYLNNNDMRHFSLDDIDRYVDDLQANSKRTVLTDGVI